MSTRKPQPSDWLAASDVAELFNWPISRAENVVRKIASQPGELRQIDGVRRIFIERRALDERIRRGNT
ncbi:MAG: hypothetical protein H0X39_00135 [Actinobacteria bacterium]|nr:hypothetical protein [Actinomycetota bacterium]